MRFDYHPKRSKEAKIECEIKELKSGTVKDNDELKNEKKRPIIAALNLNSIKN